MHKVWLNGEKVYDDRAVLYRTSPDALVERFTFRNFHGGKKDTYRPTQTQYVWCAAAAVFAACMSPSCKQCARVAELHILSALHVRKLTLRMSSLDGQ